MTSGENAIVTTVLRPREQLGGGSLDNQQFTVKDVQDFMHKEGKPYDKRFLASMLCCLSREGVIKLEGHQLPQLGQLRDPRSVQYPRLG